MQKMQTVHGAQPMNGRETIAARKARDLAMMLDPKNWPRWPVLPLKLRDGGHPWDRESVALLFASGTPVIYFANLFDIPTEIGDLVSSWADVLGACKQREYPSFEALADQYAVD